MALAIKRIMLVTRNVQFAIDVKRALEALGEYGVTTVADVRNAIEQLRDAPQHLLLLDTANLSISPAIMIEMIRSRQSEIAIVLAPDSPEVHELAHAYDLQGVVDIPVMARTLIPMLDAALQDNQDTRPKTQEVPAIDLSEDTIFIEALVDDLIDEDLALNYTRRRLQASYALLHPSAEAAEQSTARSAVELLVEPDEEGDTVRYRYIGAGDVQASTTLQFTGAEIDETPVSASSANETVRDLANSIAGGRAEDIEQMSTAPSPVGEDTDLDDSAAFEKMLSAVMDESTLLDDLTLESLFDTTRELPGALGTGAVPAWLRETEKFIREPAFLKERLEENLPPLDEPKEAEATTAPVAVNNAPAEDLPAELAAEHDDETDERVAPEAATVSDPSWAPLWSRDSDPLLAQLAVTMTQMMTDLTADATVLTQQNRIVAFSGEMALEDFRALRGVIADDWTAESSQSRIRFIRLPDSGEDFMLYSRGTVADYTLTMIFAEGKQLREIRRQGDRMLRALDSSPDSDAPPQQAEENGDSPEADSRQPFAFVWLVGDPARLLRKQVAEQLVFWLEVQLNSLNWKINRLDVHQDFIYLCADVPGRASPDALVRTVMERARMIACSEDRALPQDLWADAYLVLQPGREMSERELQSFLQFARV